MDLVSIIVPVYKVEQYLHKCVNSLLAQTYNNIEILLVDDGSPDNCGAICDEYAQNDERIIAIHKDNGGLSDARNYGLVQARGAYIAFVDGDDTIEPDMVEKLLDSIKVWDSDVAVCGFSYVDEQGEKFQDFLYASGKVDIATSRDILEAQATGEGWLVVPACVKLYKRHLIEKLSFRKGLIHEDEFFMNDLIRNHTKFSFVNECLYLYTQRDGSITHTKVNVKSFDGAQAELERMDLFWEYDYQQQAYVMVKSIAARTYRIWKNNRKDIQIADKIKWVQKELKMRYNVYGNAGRNWSERLQHRMISRNVKVYCYLQLLLDVLRRK